MLLVRTVVSPKPLQAKSPVSSLLRFLQLYCTTAIRRCTKFLFRKKQHFVIDTLLTLTQISTSVQQITEVVPLKPAALTLWAALRAHVHQDTPEVENLARVGKHKQHYKSTIITYSTCWHFCFFFLRSSFVPCVTKRLLSYSNYSAMTSSLLRNYLLY